MTEGRGLYGAPATPSQEALDARRLDALQALWSNGFHVEGCAVGGPTVHGLRPVYTVYVGGFQRSGETLREAIDAALAKGPSHE